MMKLVSLALLVAYLISLDCGLAAPANPPTKGSAKPAPPKKLPTMVVHRGPAKAPTLSKLPTMPAKDCPHNYTVKVGDTFCSISTKTGISTARLMAANPKIGLTNVTAGTHFRIPCKPETHCCPAYITAARNGTGLGDILKARPDLTLQKLLNANSHNPNVTAAFVSCGTEIRVPCKAGSRMCRGPGYPHHAHAPGKAPGHAPKKAPAHAHSPKRAPAHSPKKAPVLPAHAPKRAPAHAPKKAPVHPAARPTPAPTPRRVMAPTLGVTG